MSDEEIKAMMVEQARQDQRIRTLEREMSNRTKQLKSIEDKLDVNRQELGDAKATITRLSDKVAGFTRSGWLIAGSFASLVGAIIYGLVSGQIHIGAGS